MNICDDNRNATIEAAKTAMIKGTNIEDSPEEMKVLDSFLLRCWQMGWLDRYAPQRHFNALPKGISERMAAGHGSNVPMQPNIPPMPSNTSNALEALESVNATQSNALDCISRQAAINAIERTKRIANYVLHSGMVLRTFNDVLNSLINIMSLLPPANNSEIPNSSDTISRKAAITAIDNCECDGENSCGQPWIYKENAVETIEMVEPLPPAQTESCEDTVSRQRLLSDLKELVVAWEKYPVMAEQIKGVEAAIGYVKTIPNAQPESDSGRWERHYSRHGVYADLYWHCSKCGYKNDYQYAHVNHHYCPNCGRKMERGVNDENRIHYGRDHGQQSSRPDQNKAAVFKL